MPTDTIKRQTAEVIIERASGTTWRWELRDADTGEVLAKSRRPVRSYSEANAAAWAAWDRLGE